MDGSVLNLFSSILEKNPLLVALLREETMLWLVLYGLLPCSHH